MTCAPAFLDPAGSKAQTPCIGVFDSGVGGLSILRALQAHLPAVSKVYVGDASWAPYGDRTASEVIERSQRVVEWLVREGATMIVVACNTATVLAIEALRARWPRLVFVGVEPGIKPAAAMSRTKRIAVMVTAATAASTRLKHLIERHADAVHVHVQACPELAGAIERGLLDGPSLIELLRPHCEAISVANVDTVVLGCTHYPFVASSIRALLGSEVKLLDTAAAVARRAASVWNPVSPSTVVPARSRVFSTGETATLQRLLAQCRGLENAEVEVLTIIPSNPPG